MLPEPLTCDETISSLGNEKPFTVHFVGETIAIRS